MESENYYLKNLSYENDKNQKECDQHHKDLKNKPSIWWDAVKVLKKLSLCSFDIWKRLIHVLVNPANNTKNKYAANPSFTTSIRLNTDVEQLSSLSENVHIKTLLKSQPWNWRRVEITRHVHHDIVYLIAISPCWATMEANWVKILLNSTMVDSTFWRASARFCM